jgi:hypothetical protein
MSRSTPVIGEAVARVFDLGRFELGVEKRAFQEEFAAIAAWPMA